MLFPLNGKGAKRRKNGWHSIYNLLLCASMNVFFPSYNHMYWINSCWRTSPLSTSFDWAGPHALYPTRSLFLVLSRSLRVYSLSFDPCFSIYFFSSFISVLRSPSLYLSVYLSITVPIVLYLSWSLSSSPSFTLSFWLYPLPAVYIARFLPMLPLFATL